MMKKLSYHKTYQQEQVDYKAVDSKLIARLWQYLRPYRGWIYLAIFFLLISKALEAFVPILIGKLTQHIINKDIPFAYVTHETLWICVLLFASYSLDAVNVFLKSWVGQRALYKMRTQVFDHIEKLPLRYFDQHSVGRLMTRTIHDVEQINQMFAESIVPIIGNIVLFISMCIGMIILNWHLGLLLLLITPATIWVTNNFRANQRSCYDLIRKIVSAMNTFVQEHLLGVFTIRNFGLLQREKQQFEEMNDDYCNANLESIYNFSFFTAGIDFLQSFSLVMVFLILMSFTPAGTQFQAGNFLTFSLYALMIFRPLADLAERYNVLQSAMAASERIFDILNQKEEVTAGEDLKLEQVESIVFEDVWFAYDHENWILKGISFEINKGDSLAIVGVTGAGKTTIMSILLRFYDFQKGTVKINGIDIRKYPLKEIRKQFSVVLQDPVIFSGTLAENIGLYNEDISKEKMEAVIEYLNMRHFVSLLPKGLDQPLMERGKSLSMGEMQLVSMARAVAHDRSVLVLDEATANIDSGTEKIIQTALKKILKDKTALVIAHRLSTIKDVTRILVLHNGDVAESGTHQELIQAQGIYEKLYRLQYLA